MFVKTKNNSQQTTGAKIMQKKITRECRSTLKTTTQNIQVQINELLMSSFHNGRLESLAKETNFVQRSTSKLDGKEFIQAMVISSIDPKSTPLSGLNDILREISCKADMTISALRQRINSPKASQYIKQACQEIIKHRFHPLSKELNSIDEKGALKCFKKILIHDSSTCSLNEILQDEFKGAGGGGSKSSVKIDLIYDLKTNTAEEISFTDIRKPDQILSKNILNYVQAGDLVLQDLGYFEIDTFENVEICGAMWLSRLPSNVLVYSDKESDKPVELGKMLDKRQKKQKCLDIKIYITKQKKEVRLVAYPVPNHVFDKRVRDYRKKTKGKTPSNEWLARQKFTILITNVPKTIWDDGVIGTVYKLRWQIELIFKVWKSQLNIDYLKGTNPNRIWCLLYARMLAISLIFTLSSVIGHLVNSFGCEISLTRFVNWLKRQGRFARIILNGLTTRDWKHLIASIDLLCKDEQRIKRKTNRRMLEEEVSFLNTFQNLYAFCA